MQLVGSMVFWSLSQGCLVYWLSTYLVSMSYCIQFNGIYSNMNVSISLHYHLFSLVWLTKFDILIWLPSRSSLDFYSYVWVRSSRCVCASKRVLLSRTSDFSSPTVVVSRFKCCRTKLLQVRYSNDLMQRTVMVASVVGRVWLVKVSMGKIVQDKECSTGKNNRLDQVLWLGCSRRSQPLFFFLRRIASMNLGTNAIEHVAIKSIFKNVIALLLTSPR